MLEFMILQISVFVKSKFIGGGMMDTYGKIKELCDGKGVTFSALAAGIGVRSSIFTELKKGRTKQLSVSTLNKIAEYFGVPTSFFIDSEPDCNPADDMQEELFRKRKLLFDLSCKASPEDLDTIIKLADALVAGKNGG